MKIMISLYEDSELVHTSHKDYLRWCEISQVIIGGKIFNYNAKSSSPKEIVFTHFSDGGIVTVNSLEELDMEVSRV